MEELMKAMQKYQEKEQKKSECLEQFGKSLKMNRKAIKTYLENCICNDDLPSEEFAELDALLESDSFRTILGYLSDMFSDLKTDFDCAMRGELR
jgi:predicted solute-binding protein